MRGQEDEREQPFSMYLNVTFVPVRLVTGDIIRMLQH